MISFLSNNGKEAYGLTTYVVDTKDDIANLPKNETMGSTAFCIADSSVYMIDSEGKWVEI